MIAYLSLYQLRDDVDAEVFETLMSKTRVLLLRVPEVLTVKTGKRVNPNDPWPWFVYLEVESMDKLAICQDDPHYLKFREEVIKPHVAEQESVAFEMKQKKNVYNFKIDFLTEFITCFWFYFRRLKHN